MQMADVGGVTIGKLGGMFEREFTISGPNRNLRV
jgi:hypothetical protein